MREIKGAIIPFEEIKAVKQEFKEEGENAKYGIIKAFQQASIGQTVKVIISGNYLRGEYKERHFEKISETHAKVIGTEICGG